MPTKVTTKATRIFGPLLVVLVFSELSTAAATEAVAPRDYGRCASNISCDESVPCTGELSMWSQ